MAILKKSPLAPSTTPDLQNIEGVKLYAINNGISGSFYENRLNLSLAVFDDKTNVAGVFTKSSAASANVLACRKNLVDGKIKAFIIHAGNSNAFTGQSGFDGVTKQESALSSALNCSVQNIFTAATGVIGEELDTDKFIISQLDNLLNSECSWNDMALAITTTDTFIKCSTASYKNSTGEVVTINGIAKGSGMIAPNMATMIAFIATNAAIEQSNLQTLLEEINEESFNSTTVDSDTSTSDTVILAASNKAEIDDISKFKPALQDVMHDLAKQLAKDGEGASKFVTVYVKNASSKVQAQSVARTIADSPLVKTAIAGEDPNWGRIVMAIGKADDSIDFTNVDIKLGDINLVEKGEKSSSYNEAQAADYMKNKDIEIHVSLGTGSDNAHIYTCDLTKTYIEINADYRS